MLGEGLGQQAACCTAMSRERPFAVIMGARTRLHVLQLVSQAGVRRSGVQARLQLPHLHRKHDDLVIA